MARPVDNNDAARNPEDVDGNADIYAFVRGNADELLGLIEAAAVQAMQEPVPRLAVRLARLPYIAEKPDGPALLYTMFATWVDKWRDLVAAVTPDLDSELYWGAALEHMLLPEDGAHPEAQRLVGAFILRMLDDELLDLVDDHTSMTDESPDKVEFFYNKIFLGGPVMQAECARIVLFMLKHAFYLRNRPLLPRPDHAPDA